MQQQPAEGKRDRSRSPPGKKVSFADDDGKTEEQKKLVTYLEEAVEQKEKDKAKMKKDLEEKKSYLEALRKQKAEVDQKVDHEGKAEEPKP